MFQWVVSLRYILGCLPPNHATPSMEMTHLRIALSGDEGQVLVLGNLERGGPPNVSTPCD